MCTISNDPAECAVAYLVGPACALFILMAVTESALTKYVKSESRTEARDSIAESLAYAVIVLWFAVSSVVVMMDFPATAFIHIPFFALATAFLAKFLHDGWKRWRPIGTNPPPDWC